jgi:superfamily I DNA/RNA helicase
VRLSGVIASRLEPTARVLLLTFSNQARTQLEREATRQLTPGLRARIEITNYHRFFWHGVRAYRRALGLPLETEIVSRRRRKEALERTVPDLVRRLDDYMLDSLAEQALREFQDARTPPPDELTRLVAGVEEEHRAGRLIFDDLGALFWSLLSRLRAVNDAYGRRYRVVIADEHQDASALQDAFTRLLGQDGLVIFADPMQLIHGFRGASPERLERHRAECEAEFRLSTLHRWHGSEHIAEWLLAVRERLVGRNVVAPIPAEVVLEYTPAGRGFNAIKARVRFAALRAFRNGSRSVAVLARSNDEVGQLRRYLSEKGLKPWHIGGEDFEEARVDIEQLPLLHDSQSLAFHALGRLKALATLPGSVIAQVHHRLLPESTNLRGAGEDAAAILNAFGPIYAEGARGYFRAMTRALDVCANRGHHLPRIGAVEALRDTAQAFGGGGEDLEELLSRYSTRVIAATHTTPPAARGLFVMTAHQAKGREFDAIVLANASARFFPNDDESRRVFYVAVTRASRFWVVIAPDRNASPLLAALTGT